MPELPEAERARLALESQLGKRIAAVDDSDTYVCRPHQPGEIASALVGHTFVTAHRRGKFLWLETEDGPTLGLHLGMAGHIALEAPQDRPIWDRFTVEFEDASRFALRDRRRLGRAVLNPDFGHIGPDAALVSRAEFRTRIGAGKHGHQGAAPRPGRDLRRRQPPRRRGAVAGADRAATSDRHAERRRPRPAAPSAARRGPRRYPPRRRAHRDVRRGPRPRGILPARRPPTRARDVGGRTTYWCPACQT